jgi:hypothetical protein
MCSFYLHIHILNAISASGYKRDKTHSIIEVNTERLYISSDINSKGDTIGKIIYVYDEKKIELKIIKS